MPHNAEHHIHEYLAHLTVERNLSPRTLESYGRDLRQFRCWAEEMSLRPGDIDRIEGGMVIRRMGTRQGTALWSVENVSRGSGGDRE